MKRVLFVLVMLLAVTGFTVSAEKKDTLSGKFQYANKEKGFEIVVPRDWENGENYYGTAFIAVSPLENKKDTFRENVNVVVEPFAEGAEGYYKANLVNMKKLLTDFKELKTEKLKINSKDAVSLIYSHRMGEVNIKVLVFFMVNGKKAYCLTCSADPASFDKYSKIFKEIAETLILK